MRKNLILGLLVATRKISDSMAESEAFTKDIAVALEKYQKCDGGMVSQDDWKMNDEALEQEERLFASYFTCKGKIWIITEWDRSVTTVLFQNEY